MKAIKGMLLAVVMIFSTAAAAQTTIAGGEYWIDGAINARQALSSGASIDISSLQPGLHTLTVRVKDSNGLWSNQMARIFFVSPPGHTDATSVTAYEYWIDGVKKSEYSTLNSQVIDISDLKPGLHKVMVRVKDNLGVWSNQMTRIFFVSPSGRTDATSVTACEYWIDGVKKSGASTLNTQVIDISDLTPGLHKVMIRVKDNLGVWNNQIIRTFFVAPTPQPSTVTLAKYMYWIDNDVANAVTGDITDDSGQLFIDMTALQLGDGDHTLTWLVRDSKGVWSEKVTVPIPNYLPGDANRDGYVNVTDIVATVNYIMEKPSEGFNKAAADLTGDGEINVTDIVKMVNIIMASEARKME